MLGVVRRRSERDAELASIEAFISNVLKDIELTVCQDRVGQTNHLTVGLVRVENTRTHAADILSETHDELLADGVDSRVGDLSKLLTEIVEEDLRLVREHGERRIVTHGSGRLLAFDSHWDQCISNIFLTESELYLFCLKMVNGVAHLTARMNLLKLYTVGVQPLAVRMLMSETILDLTVVVDLAFLCIDKQDLSRLQTSFLCDDCRIEVHDTDLGSHNHDTIFGDGVSCRTQTVTVKHATGIAAVGEQQGGRTVPWLHQDRVVLVESLDILGDRVLVVEALRHHDAQGLRQRHAVHDEELEDVV